MSDITVPYRAVQEERRTTTLVAVGSWICAVAFLIVGIVMHELNKEVETLKQDNAALHTCLSHLHITMTRLDNPGPEQGVVVATVTCKGE